MLEPKRPARRSRGPGRAPTYLVYRLSTYFFQLRSRSKLAARLPSCAPIPLRRVDPAPANPNPGRDSLLSRHPVIETDASVGIAEFCTERLDLERF
jgi:hypothetical protein